MVDKKINLKDPKIAEALEKWRKNSLEMYPSTTVNGREVPVCKKCGRITDMSPVGSHDCQHCMHEFVKDLAFTI